MRKTVNQSDFYVEQYDKCIIVYQKRGWGAATFKLILKFAEEGNPFAMVTLARCYKTGDRVKEDEDKAKELYRKAYMKLNPLAKKEGDPFIEYELGRRYFEGTGTRRDYKKAADWFKKSVDHGGSYDAMYDLGYCYLQGLGVEKDEKKALELITLSADKGYYKALQQLASFYHRGELGFEQDLVKAAELYNKVGSRMGLVSVGKEFWRRKDYKQTVKCLTLASELGSIYAMEKLSEFYSEECNDPELAAYWKQKAEEAEKRRQARLRRKNRQ